MKGMLEWRLVVAIPELCIVGGSNCLLSQGWVRQLKAVNQEAFEIRNLSIGAATSLIGIYRILNGEIPNGSIVIWEYAINEANHHKSGQSAETLFYYLDWFLELCALRDISVLPLLFWNLDEQLSNKPSQYRREINRRFASRGLEPIDFGPKLKEFAGEKKQDVKALYRDRAHYKLGTGFPRRIALQVFGNLRAARIPQRLTSFAGRELRLLRPEVLETGRFKNSILDAGIYDFSAPIRIRAKGKLLAGFVIAAKTGGAVDVFVDEHNIGAFSVQSPPSVQQPDRLLKHLVFWSNGVAPIEVEREIDISRSRSEEKPIVQNLFSWHAAEGSGEQDALVAILIES
ncbi:hypothetical protein [Paracoccus sp. pheM1]|uniref:hypothetical protein n=1 Tax=Paracoccus sp. pheM1 TaxID=2831675 RepID=UPI001BDB77FF|nr:hypothetical protein [Paracoccus sp. pheM1]MBT0778975.1 hypothetical protein [Paracoccus sp. pheM1]